MSAPKHTPEPWRTECWASHAPRSVVANLDPAEPTEVGGQTVLHLGRVHVACVNFCAGLTNEQLHATEGAIHGYEKFQALATQRDELLAIVKEARERTFGSSPAIKALAARMDAAIAEVQS